MLMQALELKDSMSSFDQHSYSQRCGQRAGENYLKQTMKEAVHASKRQLGRLMYGHGLYVASRRRTLLDRAWHVSPELRGSKEI